MRNMNLEEAKNICSTYQHLLRSSSFIQDRIEVVEAILPAPYNQRDQWTFYNLYNTTKSLEAATDPYKNDPFDIIVLIKVCYADGLIDYGYMTLENFLAHRRSLLPDP